MTDKPILVLTVTKKHIKQPELRNTLGSHYIIQSLPLSVKELTGFAVFFLYRENLIRLCPAGSDAGRSQKKNQLTGKSDSTVSQGLCSCIVVVTSHQYVQSMFDTPRSQSGTGLYLNVLFIRQE